MELTCAGRTAVVIPAYKPDDRLPPYVQALKDAGSRQNRRRGRWQRPETTSGSSNRFPGMG